MASVADGDQALGCWGPGGGGGANKGFSTLRHLQGKGCKTGLCGQAWSFPLFDPM